MARNDGSLIFDTKIDRKGFEDGVKQLGNVGAKAFGAITKIVAGTTAAVSAIGIASIKVGSTFESSMAGVAATMGITVDEINQGSESFEMLKAAAKQAGATTKYSASESAEALNYLALAGYDAEKSVAALPTVLNLASAGGLELAYASDLLTDSMSALGLEMDQLDTFVDELAKASQKSNTSVGQLGEAILTVGGTAKIMAGGTVELSTQLGILADNGIKGAEGGTALRNVLLSLSAPTEKQAKLMKQLGIETYDANGEFRSTDDIFTDLNGILGEMTEQDRTAVLSDLFNKVDLKAANALLAGSGERFGELSNEIANAEGAAANMAETLENNLKGKITILKSALEGVGISIYENIDAPVAGVVETLTGYVDQIGRTLTAHEDIEKSAAELGMTAEELGYDLSKIPNGLDGAVEIIGDIIADMIVKVAESAPKMLDAAIKLIKSFIKGIVNNKEEIIKSTVQVIDTLVKGFIDLVPELILTGIELLLGLIIGLSDTIPELIPVALEVILAFVEGLIDNIDLLVDAAIALTIGLAEGLINSIPIIIEKAPIIVNKLVDALVENAGELTYAAIQLIFTLGAALISEIPNLIKNVPKIVKALFNAFTLSFQGIAEIGKNLIKGLWEGIKSMGNWIGDKVKGFATGILNGFKGIFGIRSPSTVMAGYGKNIAEGLALGVKENQSKAEKAMYDMAQSIVKEYDRLGDAVLSALRKKYREEETLQLKNLKKQTDNVREEINERIKEYDKEFQAKLKTLNAETSEEMKELQKQIDNINNKTKEEEKQLREQEYNTRVALKEKELLEATNSKDRLKIQEELNKMRAEKEREQLLESRELQIKALRDEMDRIQEQARNKQIELEKEHKAKIDKHNQQLNDLNIYHDNETEAIKAHYATLLKEENLQAEARRLILDENNQELIELLESYNPHWQNAGQSFGESLLLGLNSMKSSIQNEVNEILGLINQADMEYARSMNSDSGYVDNAQNQNIIQAKKDWELAKAMGDTESMKALEKLAEEMRKQGGTIGADVSLEEALRMSGQSQNEMGRTLGGVAGTQSTSITNNKGITQNVTIVSPQNTPSENARQLKRVGRELLYEY